MGFLRGDGEFGLAGYKRRRCCVCISIVSEWETSALASREGDRNDYRLYRTPLIPTLSFPPPP